MKKLIVSCLLLCFLMQAGGATAWSAARKRHAKAKTAAAAQSKTHKQKKTRHRKKGSRRHSNAQTQDTGQTNPQTPNPAPPETKQ